MMKNKHFVVVIIATICGLSMGIAKPVVGEIKPPILAQRYDDEMGEFERLLWEAAELSTRGKYNQAILRFEGIWYLLKKAGASETIEAAKVLDFFGLLHQRQGRYKKAQHFYQRASVIREKVKNAEPPSRFDLSDLDRPRRNLLVDNSDILVESKQPTLSLDWYSLPGNYETIETAKFLDFLGLLHRSGRRYKKAQHFYQRASAIREKLRNREVNREVNEVKQLLQEATQLSVEGKYKQGMKIIKKALDIVENIGVSETYIGVAVFNILSMLHYNLGNIEEAKKHEQRASAIREKLRDAEPSSSRDFAPPVIDRPMLFESDSPNLYESKFYYSAFVIPTKSRPGNRGDGGGRSDPNNPPKLCPQMEKPLLALIPQSNLGYTLASHPTFWLYIPGYSKSINFTLIDEATGNKIYQTKFNVESELGIISLKLPSAAPPLKVGKQYRWRFVFDCGSGADNLSVDGVVERVAASDSFTSRLNSAATVMEKIDIYAENGLWYETITELGNLRRSNPDDVAIKARWNSLLQQDYIRFPDYDLTSEPIQDCCNVGDK